MKKSQPVEKISTNLKKEKIKYINYMDIKQPKVKFDLQDTCYKKSPALKMHIHDV